MIQAPLPKPVETPKAQPREARSSEVESNKKTARTNDSKGSKKSKESKESAETDEFANELETSLSKNEAKVQPVKVTAEQALELPSTLVNPTSTETASPKVFDPELTKGVQNLIGPKTTEAAVPLTDAQVLELANAKAEVPEDMKAEIAQAMLKTPKVSGRAPAIDFAKAEIDPQLLNNEDFVAQKNLAAKKMMPNAYGMKIVPQEQKAALEAGLKQSQVVNNTSDASSTNSQQFLLNMSAEQQQPLQTNETQAAPKVFDMNNVKTSNANEVMNQITDYVVQAKAAKEPTVNMRINHDELGMIDITVSKSGVNHESIAVNIGTHSLDGKNFFQQNSKDLFSHLATAGLNVSDLKVETPNQTAKNDFDFNSQNGKNQPGADKQFGSEQNQRRHEQERRQDLWKLLNKEAA